MIDDLPYWLALNEYPKFGPRSLARLYDFFGSMEAAFKAPLPALIEAGIRTKTAEGFVYLRQEINPEKLHNEIKRRQVKALTINDDAYPPLLKTIYDPPPLLYVLGELPAPECAHVAIVGSRAATDYGQRVAAKLAGDLAEAGAVIVSGLAYGIDEATHLATLRAKGLTIAVIASGILRLTSRQYYLTQKILQHGGAVISEFPLHAESLKHNFPIRNRIISGICQGTLVIEAGAKSGSLITAQSALEQNREVFAVPGPINSPTSIGTNNLLKMGAHVVTEAADVLDVLKVEHLQPRIESPKTADSQEEATILEFLSKSPIHIDEITRHTQLDSVKVASTLSLMEMKGRARQIGGMYYILS